MSNETGQKTPARMRDYTLPKPEFYLTIIKLSAWSVAILKYWSYGLWSRISFSKKSANRGKLLRHILEDMGVHAIKIGHEIALRLDILPLDICNELLKMQNSGPAIDIQYVIARVEYAGGKYLQEQFQVFDPDPIVSDTTSCVYQAILKDGSQVAVKVRRPQLLSILSAEIKALGLLLGLLEFFTLVRPGTFGLLENELRLKLGEELDFSMAARYQQLFRRRARRSNLKFLSSARIYHEYSSFDVMISEFISGVWCHEIVQAQTERNMQMKAWLASQNINPTKVAKRLLQVMWWAQFENPFFPVEPRAENIVIQPGNKIIFVNLGECGRISGGKREIYFEALRRLSINDVSGSADMLLQLLSPLPFIDPEEFRSLLELQLWQHLFSLRHNKSLPWERTSNRMWLDFLQTAHKFGVPVHLEIIRLMRSNLMTEHIASLLWPKMSLLKELHHYQFSADKRKIERATKDIENDFATNNSSVSPIQVNGLFERIHRLRFWVDTNTRSMPLQFMSLSAKGAFFVSAVLRLITTGFLVGGVIFVILSIISIANGKDESLLTLALNSIQQPVFVFIMLVIVVLTVRKILHRLGDRDQS